MTDELESLRAQLAEVEMHYADCMDEERMLRTQLAEAQQHIYDLTNPETGEVPTLEAQLAELKQKLALNELSNDELARTERYEFLLAEKNAEIAQQKERNALMKSNMVYVEDELRTDNEALMRAIAEMMEHQPRRGQLHDEIKQEFVDAYAKLTGIYIAISGRGE